MFGAFPFGGGYFGQGPALTPAVVIALPGRTPVDGVGLLSTGVDGVAGGAVGLDAVAILSTSVDAVKG